MKLDQDNYHSPESNREYMSYSQYKSFLRCEASTMAELAKEWKQEPSEPMLLGSFIDTALLTPDRLEAFDEAHNTRKRDGEYKVGYKAALYAMERIKLDPAFMAALDGWKQQIITFEMAGIQWKAMFDVVNYEKSFITDLKYMRSLRELQWSDEHGAKVEFYEAMGYWGQLAVYREAYKSKIGFHPEFCFIAGVSKETPADHDLWSFQDDFRFEREIDKIKNNLARIKAVKSGEATPHRCKRCDYCRATHRVSVPILAGDPFQ